VGDEDDDFFSASEYADGEHDRGTRVHGFHKVLLSPGMERDSWASLKEGLTVFYNTASAPTQTSSPFLGLVQLWGLVSHGCAKGKNVIRRVYTRTSLSRAEEVK